MNRQSEIDAGRLPAENVVELVSALRQSVSAAYIECNTALSYLDIGETEKAREAIERCQKRVVSADQKMTLAIDHARPT